MKAKSTIVIKYSLFAFNLIFVVSSIALMCVGLIIHKEYLKYQELLEDQYFSWPMLLVFLGGIMLLVTFFGCCGAIQENYCMTMMFSIMMIAAFILELMAGFSGFSLSGRTKQVLTTSLNDTMALYNKSAEITQVWDGLQTNLECCGVNKYSDWYPVLNGTLPLSCCTTSKDIAPQQFCNATSVTLHYDSCLSTLSYVVSENTMLLCAVGLAIALCQIVGIMFSCFLAKNIRFNYEQF